MDKSWQPTRNCLENLTPFNDVPQSDYTVVAKMDVTNDSLGYNEKNRHFYLETTRTMIPTRYTIDFVCSVSEN